jgi:TPP-dependent pyruvate/acetoin dehydrogenase alpha subunit
MEGRSLAARSRTAGSTKSRAKTSGRRRRATSKITVPRSLSKEKLVWMYRTMRQIREFEGAADRAYQAARMRGALHFYIGEEASAAGVCAALEPTDYITSTHRGHGHCIAKGAQLNKMMAELFGRTTGYCGGKGGSMHIADLDLGNLGANGIVGGGMPIAAGAGLSCKLQQNGRVTVCFFGDGAGATGSFHEAVNFAGVYNLPVVFWCENNQYGMGTRASVANAGGSIARRGAGYGTPGEEVDGNDVFAVYTTAKRAVERARAGKGPSLIEALTYRHRGHTIHDQKGYRPREEIEEWMQKDPLERFRQAVVAGRVLTRKELDAIDAEVEEEIAAAVEFAEASPWPTLDAVERDVFVE